MLYALLQLLLRALRARAHNRPVTFSAFPPFLAALYLCPTARPTDVRMPVSRGGFSEVRACRCRQSGQEIAAKVISKRQHLNKPRRLRRLRDEMRVLAKLRHPHIVPLLAVYETSTDLLLLMERAHGGELFDRIVAKGYIPPAPPPSWTPQREGDESELFRRSHPPALLPDFRVSRKQEASRKKKPHRCLHACCQP